MSPRSPREISVLVPPDLAPLYPDDPSRIGPYLVLGRLGQGATGTVYAAVDAAFSSPGDRLVAVKVLTSPELDSPDVYPALEQRLRALSNTDPRRVVVPLDFDSDANPPWLSMPYLAGERLSHYVTKRGGLGTGKLIALATGLAEGLSALHTRGVAHGSLRPSEVLLESHGPHIMECAVAASAERMRGAGATWLSPERFRGGGATPAADVFAWGAVVSFAGTGRLPFGPGEPEEIAERAAHGSFDLDGLARGLRPVVGRALDPDPDRRPSLREVIGAVIAVWQSENADHLRGSAASPAGNATGAGSPGRDDLALILEREWHAVEPPARVPQVVRLEGRMSNRRTTRALFLVGSAALALVLVGAGIWGISRMFDPDDTLASDAAGESVEGEPVDASPSADEDPLTLVVRFDPAEQESPESGPWVYTPVDRDDEPVRGQGVPSHSAWAEQWDEAGEPAEAVISPDAEVLCAKFCAAPNHVFLDEEGRGTWELTGGDFIDYLSWGPVMIVEVTFAEEPAEDGGPREIVKVTELFTE
ncbi:MULTISPECIES: serine/threonine protein kinase [Nocardiopsis]|uniref:Serine/threonine protein kinase n=1 Tax=Nocardiopsis sinuspersici TaxID=501010 RepID=A0A1V3C1M8_9ACTN|nr:MULTISPECIES: serine/threonine-protein kinase [Nocardiopsis]OOC54667.1 serine/threonine protein kinase [Nocardiopsis sinuspersici]